MRTNKTTVAMASGFAALRNPRNAEPDQRLWCKKYDAGPLAQSTDGVKGPTDVASAALARHELLLPTATVVTPLVNRMCWLNTLASA